MSSCNDTPTVRICVVCLGNLITTIELNNGMYTSLKCKWCDGTGIMTDEQYKYWKLMKKEGKIL